MTTANQGRAPTISACITLALLVPLAAWAMPPQQSSDQQSQQGSAAVQPSRVNSPAARPPDQIANVPLPDSPGVLYSQTLIQDQTAGGQQTSTQNQQGTIQQPTGTAAARTASPAGVAASEPAGAAIAPAKQRRVRTILISVGAVLGAGAALGAVAALSAGSPSRPPGAH
jgi:hypothetical protein